MSASPIENAIDKRLTQFWIMSKSFSESCPFCFGEVCQLNALSDIEWCRADVPNQI